VPEDLDEVNRLSLIESLLTRDSKEEKEDSDPEEDQTEELLKRLKSVGITKDFDEIEKQKLEKQN